MTRHLTVRTVETLKAEINRIEEPDGLVVGLYLVVQPSGAKSWAVRYRHAGQPKKLTLGKWPAIDLPTARELARKALRSVAEGANPAAEKKAAKHTAAETAEPRDKVEEIVASFIERHVKPNNKASTAKETERLLKKDVVSVWKGRRIQTITKGDVILLLDAVVDRGATIGANRTLAALRKMFNWCVGRGILETSPCDRVTAPTGERSRDRVLTDTEIPLIWRSAEKLGWPFGPIVQLLLLTGQRREEVCGMRWAEIDLDKRLWIIPGERTKNGRVHEVPLSSEAVAILTALPRIASKAGLVFSTTGETQVSGYSRAKGRLDTIMRDALRTQAKESGASEKAVEEVTCPEWRFHDLRRTMSSNMARLGINLPVIEKVLNHVSGSFAGVVGVYQRHNFSDEKRAALEQWAEFLTTAAEHGRPQKQ